MDASPRRNQRLITAALAIAAVYSVMHMVVSGVIQPFRTPAIGQVIEELQPLYRLFTTGSATVDHPRQYGPVFLFLFHPVYKVTLARPDLLAWYAYALDVVAIVIAFLATRLAIFSWAASRGISLPRETTAALLLLWMNFSPLYGVLAVKNVELWELALIAVGGAALLKERRWLAAWAIAAAALIKMLPLVFLPFLLLRDRRTFAYAVAALVAILTVSQMLYGWQMGWGYLPMILNAALGGEGYGNVFGLTWHENVSIRGLAFKAFGYLETPIPGSQHPYQLGYYVVVPDALRPYALATSWLAQAAAVIWLLIRLSKGRTRRFTDLVYWEWALIAVMMLVLAPQISQDYMVLSLGAFSYVLIGCMLRNTLSLWLQFGLAVLLVGNVLPRALFARLVLTEQVTRLAGHDHLLLAEAYQYFGFPLLGLLILLHVWSRVSEPPISGESGDHR